MEERENLVVFKGCVDGITVVLDQKVAFEELLEQFVAKLQSSKKFFKGAKVSMRFKGRELSQNQQDQLMRLLTDQNIVNVSFVHQFEQQNVPQTDEYIHWLTEEDKKPHTSMTHFHYGMVRSGQHIDYPGSVVVLGDVNPGGIITAGGNIIIMGTLNGKVHAGVDLKLKRAFVMAHSMHPIQIGIGNIIAQSPDAGMVARKKEILPQIAYVSKEQIYVEEIDYKTLMHMVE